MEQKEEKNEIILEYKIDNKGKNKNIWKRFYQKLKIIAN